MMKRSRAECLEAELSDAEDRHAEQRDVFGSGAEDNETKHNGVL